MKNMVNKSILIVDDESRMRKLIKDFLVAKGYDILEAEDGEKALKVFEENESKIELILLDVMMPKTIQSKNISSKSRGNIKKNTRRNKTNKRLRWDRNRQRRKDCNNRWKDIRTQPKRI